MKKILTNDLPASTTFVIMKTDYYKGEPCPRMCQPDWSWGGAHQSTVYPATVPGMHENLKSKITRKRWPKNLVLFYRNLNAFNLEYAFKVTNGNINNGDPKQQIDPAKLDSLTEMPKFEVITYVGNTHMVKSISSKGVLLDTLDFNADLFDSQKVNYKSSVYVSKFSAIREDGYLFNLFNPPDDNYLPLVSYDVFYIPLERAELYPPLGNVTITGSGGLNIRDAPAIGGEKIGSLPYGVTVNVKKYFPTMGNVWGLTEYGWIALRYQPYPGAQKYYESTTWKLETAPPPRPYHSLPEFNIKPPTYNLTNQKMINIFYTAGGKLDIPGWMLIERAGLTSLAIPNSNRQLMYTGPKIEDIPSLNDHEKDVILSLLGSA
jgi:hypothetical protein